MGCGWGLGQAPGSVRRQGAASEEGERNLRMGQHPHGGPHHDSGPHQGCRPPLPPALPRFLQILRDIRVFVEGSFLCKGLNI